MIHHDHHDHYDHHDHHDHHDRDHDHDHDRDHIRVYQGTLGYIRVHQGILEYINLEYDDGEDDIHDNAAVAADDGVLNLVTTASCCDLACPRYARVITHDDPLKSANSTSTD